MERDREWTCFKNSRLIIVSYFPAFLIPPPHTHTHIPCSSPYTFLLPFTLSSSPSHLPPLPHSSFRLFSCDTDSPFLPHTKSRFPAASLQSTFEYFSRKSGVLFRFSRIMTVRVLACVVDVKVGCTRSHWHVTAAS